MTRKRCVKLKPLLKFSLIIGSISIVILSGIIISERYLRKSKNGSEPTFDFIGNETIYFHIVPHIYIDGKIYIDQQFAILLENLEPAFPPMGIINKTIKLDNNTYSIRVLDNNYNLIGEGQINITA